ncbi:MAG: hypothetical protein AAFY46_14290, partial [Planctomycetota bacterium]
MFLKSAAAVCSAALLAVAASGQTLDDTFTYQGELLERGRPVDGQFDFRFRRFTQATGGISITPDAVVNDVTVDDGYVEVEVDFTTSGVAFNGNRRWLEVAVRPSAGGTGTFTVLGRKELTATPNASFALRSGSSLDDAYSFG